MSAKLLNGNALSQEILDEVRLEVDQLNSRNNRPPGLAVIMVGNHPASASYVKKKIRSCERVGFLSRLIHLDEAASQDEVLDEVEKLNQDSAIDGFIVQLPLPDHIDVEPVISAIDPNKDVDGFHPVNVGNVTLGREGFISATPNGILEMLERYHIETKGKNVVVVGRSNIVGRPMSILLSQKRPAGNATVTVTHRYTENLKQITQWADIIIVAVGSPNTLTADMVKEDAVIIDVGMNRIEDKSKKSGFRLVGDVDFDALKNKVSAITPVPGGVGPMTVCSLIQNTLKAYKKHEDCL